MQYQHNGIHVLKVYQVSHRQVFHLNSKPQIYHRLTFQVISHQIIDNIHNHHGSIGLYKVRFWQEIWLWLFWPFPFLFPFLFLFGVEQESRHKDLVCNQRRRSLYTPHVLTKLLLLLSLFFFFLFDNSAHCSDIVWSNELVFLFHFPLLFLYL